MKKILSTSNFPSVNKLFHCHLQSSNLIQKLKADQEITKLCVTEARS